MLDFSCSRQDLWSSLQRVGSLVAYCKLLVVALGSSPLTEIEPRPLAWEHKVFATETTREDPIWVLLISMYDTRIENRENLKIFINSFEFIFIINLSHVNTNQILIFSKLPSATLWEECHYFTFLQIFLIYDLTEDKGFPDGSDGKELACSEEDLTLIPRLGRSPGEWNGNPLQYSCLGNPTDRGAWWAAVPGVSESDTI